MYDVKQRRVVYIAQLPDGMYAWLNGTQEEKAPTCYSENTMGRTVDSHILFIDDCFFFFF